MLMSFNVLGYVYQISLILFAYTVSYPVLVVVFVLTV